MKKTLFVSMNGSCGKYATPIKTTTKCGNSDLIALQQSLNELFKEYKNADATESNLSTLWAEIQKIFRLVAFKPSNSVESSAYAEIVNAIQEMGKKIAYFNKRDNIYPFTYYHDLLLTTPEHNTALLAERYRKYMFTSICWRPFEIDKIEEDLQYLEMSVDDDEWCASEARKMIADWREFKEEQNAERKAAEDAEIAKLIVSPSEIAKIREDAIAVNEMVYDCDDVVDNIHPNLFKFSFTKVMNDVEVAKELNSMAKKKGITREQIMATLMYNFKNLAAAA